MYTILHAIWLLCGHWLNFDANTFSHFNTSAAILAASVWCHAALSSNCPEKSLLRGVSKMDSNHCQADYLVEASCKPENNCILKGWAIRQKPQECCERKFLNSSGFYGDQSKGQHKVGFDISDTKFCEGAQSVANGQLCAMQVTEGAAPSQTMHKRRCNKLKHSVLYSMDMITCQRRSTFVISLGSLWVAIVLHQATAMLCELIILQS